MGIFTLDTKALLLAILMGLILFEYSGLSSLLIMIIFLLLATHITGIGYYEKRSLGVYEYERGILNVFSNGIIPLVLAFYKRNFFPFLGSVAAITADKFGSEAGVLGGKPIELFTFKRVKPGKSGAISLFGSFASLAGSSLIAISAFFLFNLNGYEMLNIAISGFLGSFVDSIFGYFEERGIGNKYTSNLMGSLGGAVFAYIFHIYGW